MFQNGTDVQGRETRSREVVLTLSSQQTEQVSLQTVKIQMRRITTSRLIRTYIFCRTAFAFDFRLKPFHVLINIFELEDGIVHFKKPG